MEYTSVGDYISIAEAVNTLGVIGILALACIFLHKQSRKHEESNEKCQIEREQQIKKHNEEMLKLNIRVTELDTKVQIEDKLTNTLEVLVAKLENPPK